MQTLARLVESQGPLAVRDAIGWVLRAALAVWELHAVGEAHGNIHAGAILVEGEDCRAAGLLLRASDVDEDPLYHSVARVEGMGPTLRDDLWGLSVTMYFVLTGKLPFPKGIAEALSGGRFRAPPPLAVIDSDLDVMQPLLDRFLRVDDPDIATAVEQLVFAIQDFSPTIADLQALPLGAGEGDAEKSSAERPEAATAGGGEGRRRARRAARRSQLAMGLVGCGLLFVALSIYARGNRTPDEELAPPQASPPATTPPPVATTRAAPGTSASAATVDTASGATATASAAPSPEGPPSEADPPPDPATLVGASEDLVACMSAMLPGDAFSDRKRAAHFPCRERDGAALRKTITAALVEGGGGRATKAAREWSSLGWYRLAAIAIARSHCCSSTAPIETPPLLDLCEIDEALTGLATTTRAGTDREVADALDAYRLAIHCALTAGGAGFFGQNKPPTKQEAAVFLGMVRRVRAKRPAR